jgi:membrane protein implicated in regulation of membrane protease activity
MSTKAWLISAVVFVLIEIIPPPTHFGFLCLAFGALAAAITNVYTSIAWLPWVVFAMTSVALAPLLVPLARFLFSTKPHATNVDAIVGQRALVLETISSKGAGVVKIHGESWRATSEFEQIEKGEWAQIIRVDGTHVIVTPVAK